MAKHTPGPWFHTWSNRITRSPDGDGSDSICHVYDTNAPGEHEANTRLIAAAPDLLDALKALRDAVAANPAMQGREYVGLGIQVNAAITKATAP